MSDNFYRGDPSSYDPNSATPPPADPQAAPPAPATPAPPTGAAGEQYAPPPSPTYGGAGVQDGAGYYAPQAPGTGYASPQASGYPPQPAAGYPPQPPAGYQPAPGGAYPSAPGYQGPGGGWASSEENGTGTAAMILGILGLTVLPLIGSIVAIVLGNKGRRAADEGRATNRSSSVAGIIMGWVGIGLGILTIVLVVFLFMVGLGAYNNGHDSWVDLTTIYL
ncbi:MAG: DUF4190 domain-containing protein [Bifidobacteriaceae bacterium]|nr:DUF4190 domain-containing protein [Bifidobacteriaceae bacterium]